MRHSWGGDRPRVRTGRLAFAGCDNVVVVGQRPTTRRIKSSVRMEVAWFGRIASDEHLRISLQMA